MSETLLGVVVGGGIALIVSTVGFFIQGYFSVRTLRLQSEISKNVRYEERLIQNRAKYLEPLRETTVKCSKISESIMMLLVTISGVYSKNEDPPDTRIVHISDVSSFDKSVNAIKETWNKLNGEIDNLHHYCYEVTDRKLCDLIAHVSGDCVSNGSDFLKIISDSRKNSNKNADIAVDFTLIWNGVQKSIASFHKINQSIEELLSGKI